jgi:hypothetical protein
MNFEPFCGDTKQVERPESRVEEELAAKKRKKTQSTCALRDSGVTRQWLVSSNW